MAEDDFDYHITFPSPSSSEMLPTSEDEPPDPGQAETDNLSEEQNPTVILLGWAGCKDKHLAKYSAIYDEKRCVTIRYICPMSKVFWEPTGQRVAAYKLLELIDDYGLTDNPVLFHVFSNGGAFIYRQIVDILATSGSQQFPNIQVRGCVFDSAPAKTQPFVAARALMNSMPGNILRRFLTGMCLFTFIVLMKVLDPVLKTLGLVKKPSFIEVYSNFWEDLVKDKHHWPQMFLFSKADKVASWKSIAEFVREREKQMVSVRTVCWDDSPHVGHLKFHRESYVNQCRKFLESCCL